MCQLCFTLIEMGDFVPVVVAYKNKFNFTQLVICELYYNYIVKNASNLLWGAQRREVLLHLHLGRETREHSECWKRTQQVGLKQGNLTSFHSLSTYNSQQYPTTPSTSSCLLFFPSPAPFWTSLPVASSLGISPLMGPTDIVFGAGWVCVNTIQLAPLWGICKLSNRRANCCQSSWSVNWSWVRAGLPIAGGLLVM